DWRVPTSQEFQNTIAPEANQAAIVAQGGDPIQQASYTTCTQPNATQRNNYDTRTGLDPIQGWAPFITNKRASALVRCVKSTR
ncbi:MAG: hypothetical protein RR354_07760, partial [Mucinivorans sp.]